LEPHTFLPVVSRKRFKRLHQRDTPAVAIELDKWRFDELSQTRAQLGGRGRAIVEGEFVAATDAFGNRDGDLRLIDWSIEQINRRLSLTLSGEELWRWRQYSRELHQHEVIGERLWEAGMKERAIQYLDKTTRAMKEYFPSLYRVLIQERNLVMSARLMEIARQESGSRDSVLVLIGMATLTESEIC